LVELIARKRDGGRLDEAEIRELVAGLLDGRVADYQMSAWLMAAWLRGLDDAETLALTYAMLESGKTLALPGVDRPKVDKHSTGGVGDKISIALAPLVAACGAAVPMICGRGLGHTGGTLDKLEAIPGFRVALSLERFEQIVRDVGVAVVGQTDELAPADRRIYALRDVTATVESIPLIVASILSKKLAENIDALVLDVKVGCGAFMRDRRSATALARALVQVGTRAGVRVDALLTDMNVPLGLTVGNALETREAINVLRGGGPADVRELTFRLGERMLVSGGLEKRARDARRRLENELSSGAALECFARMVRAQGGDTRVVDDPRRFAAAPAQLAVTAPRSGFVTRCDARELGWTAVALGAGRTRADQKIDPRVGIELRVKPGARVERGETLAVLHAASRRGAPDLVERARGAFGIGARKPRARKLVLQTMRRRGT
jgi:pyrimidine-nucleoside phosphorylase